ncbi:hypothetical protein QOZ80_1AG0023520 [Eleusine coracana subsp. coracana]|nr:hypothetical protein QOZ80_1AG0023520 [Eleusine coracana subsp. coracana]
METSEHDGFDPRGGNAPNAATLRPQPSLTDDICGLHIGRLCSGPSLSSSSSSKAGYHELAGTKVTLKKPLLVLRKKKVHGDDQETPTTAAADVELEVIGIIRHKILFKDRPKALISKPPVKEKKTI